MPLVVKEYPQKIPLGLLPNNVRPYFCLLSKVKPIVTLKEAHQNNLTILDVHCSQPCLRSCRLKEITDISKNSFPNDHQKYVRMKSLPDHLQQKKCIFFKITPVITYRNPQINLDEILDVTCRSPICLIPDCRFKGFVDLDK